MNWRINIASLLIVLSGCQQGKPIDTEKQITPDEVVKFDNLIEIETFKRMAHHAHIKILDFRKKELYDKEHIMDALPIWRTDIEHASYPYRGMMASPTQIENLFSRLGIGANDTLIVYDDNGLCNAARLWWILQNYNFTNVKLFHGGLDVWKENNGSVTSEIPKIKDTVFKLTETPSMKYHISKEEMLNTLNAGVVILDTRSLDEFSGKRQKKGATKAGRIPKSIHIDWAETIDYNGGKKIKPIQDLEAIYSHMNVSKEDPVIVYCHSGMRSAHTTFVLTQLLGYKNVKNYDGSWTEWSSFENLPFEKDSLTTIIN
jgi:thiosulfate/3-mercaptopyruvate sulfurtransferase